MTQYLPSSGQYINSIECKLGNMNQKFLCIYFDKAKEDILNFSQFSAKEDLYLINNFLMNLT